MPIFLEQFFNQMTWILPITLVILAFLQLLYLGWLGLRSGPRHRARQQPESPIMPTQPDVHSSGSNVHELSVSEPITAAKMVVLSGLPGIGEVELPGNQFLVGRFYNPSAQVLIALNERSISRRHAVFRANPATREYYLADAGSSYGTSIRKSDHFELLAPGQQEQIFNNDVVQFGMTVTVRFILPGSTRSSATQV